MATLWTKLGGLLHNGISLYACDVCPCPDDSSSFGSSFGSGSSVASDSCTSSTCVEFNCCPGVQIPIALTMTFTGGSCAGTYTLTYDAGSNSYFSDDSPVFVNLSCEVFGWYFNVTDQAFSPTTESCDPFQLVFDVIGDVFCGDFTVTITG